MMRVLWDPNIPALMPEVQSAGEQNLHLQYIRTCVMSSHPHLPQTCSSQMHGMMIQPSMRKPSQQHHWLMKCGLKIQFQVDTYASTKYLMSHITSVPTLVHTDTLTPGWTYYIQHHEVKQCLTTNWWTSVISNQIFQTSWWWCDNDIPDLADISDAVWLA